MSFASQAALSSLLRYAPQKSALAELQREAENNFRNSVQAGVSSGRLGTQAIERAIPEMGGVYGRAEAQRQRAQDLLAPTLEHLGPHAQGFKTAAANEAAYGGEALARERAAAMNQLQQEKVAAATGPEFTARAAGQTLAHELAKIVSREGGLGAQEGAYAAGQLEKLEDQAKKEAAAAARFEKGLASKEKIAHEGNLTKENIAKLKGAAKLQSGAEQAKASEAVQTMLHRLEISGLPRREAERTNLIKKLSTTRPEQSIEVEPGVKTKIPKITGYPVGPQMNAAIDQWIYGYINPVHEAHLKEQGYNVKALGLTRYSERPRQPQSPASGVYGAVR